MVEAVCSAGLHDGLARRHERRSDGVLTGSGFDVEVDGDDPAHTHASWRELRARIQGCRLDAAVRQRAVDIFAMLADAEARVRGLPSDEVTFHEVGAWDSTADIASAAWPIELQEG